MKNTILADIRKNLPSVKNWDNEKVYIVGGTLEGHIVSAVIDRKTFKDFWGKTVNEYQIEYHITMLIGDELLSLDGTSYASNKAQILQSLEKLLSDKRAEKEIEKLLANK